MLANLEFKYPFNALYLIPAVTAVIFLIISFRKKEKILALLHLNYKIRMKPLRTALIFLGLALIVFSLLGPQIFEGYGEVQKAGMDIYVLMDTSKSMLVADIKPDRMSIAKKIVGDLLNNLEGDRIGFIPFSSDAYIQMPLTDDYPLARMFLDVMDTNMISGGGTNLAAAVKLANDSFERASDSDKVIIILSDGEEHENNAQDILKNVTNDGVKIYTIGVGTEKGGLVPIYGDESSESEVNSVVDYMKDENGNPVTSRLGADTLKSLAQEGGGAYYQAGSQGIDILSLKSELSTLTRDIQTLEKARKFNQIYQYFLGTGILMFLIGWFLPDRRGNL